MFDFTPLRLLSPFGSQFLLSDMLAAQDATLINPVEGQGYFSGITTVQRRGIYRIRRIHELFDKLEVRLETSKYPRL